MTPHLWVPLCVYMQVEVTTSIQRLSSLVTDELAPICYSEPEPGFGVRLPSSLEPSEGLLATDTVSSMGFPSDPGAARATIQDAVFLSSRYLGSRFVTSRCLGEHRFRAQKDIYHGL